MTTRNRTFLFIQYRNAFGHGHRRQSFAVGTEHEGLIRPGSPAVLLSPATRELPPQWVDLVEEVNSTVDEAKRDLRTLDGLHRKHLLPGFDDRTGEEAEIARLTQSITQRLRDCHRSVTLLSGSTATAEGQESVVGRNIQMSLAMSLQELSDTFRKMQTEYLSKMRARQGLPDDATGDSMADSSTIANTYGGADPLGVQRAATTFDLTLTDEQILIMEQNESAIGQRESEIDQVAKSISQLAEIFQSLQKMVIDQGTILDRIDYNVEQTANYIQKGTEELEHAEQIQKKNTATKCMFILAAIAIALIIILALKKSGTIGSSKPAPAKTKPTAVPPPTSAAPSATPSKSIPIAASPLPEPSSGGKDGKDGKDGNGRSPTVDNRDKKDRDPDDGDDTW
ncbi:t-SNARE [Ramicandelaber brevisporus]|nr:t-SNARE [Ramicandelaber brevisporus]